ncbi:hypothetical protein NOF04DRAFT_1281887 [Fusarium oxysporum II5]|nr:hypothetical protein NOF04DRAFT_1281887 [Fusarium oxysporum II5]
MASVCGHEICETRLLSTNFTSSFDALHCTVTGEATASITRGPFTLTLVPHPLQGGFTHSNFYTDLYCALALMGLTYTNAWKFSESLAMGDVAFSAALAHVRNPFMTKLSQ